MRNFYLTADIDGRQTLLTGGPQAKAGGMTVEVRQRDEGRSVVAFKILCIENNGTLETIVRNSQGQTVASFETTR